MKAKYLATLAAVATLSFGALVGCSSETSTTPNNGGTATEASPAATEASPAANDSMAKPAAADKAADASKAAHKAADAAKDAAKDANKAADSSKDAAGTDATAKPGAAKQ